jgi:aryl-phospho-beta-D-glucosidase BglC (GH1 family)
LNIFDIKGHLLSYFVLAHRQDLKNGGIMTRRILSAISVIVLGLACWGCSTSRGIDPLQRGVNLSHWFSQTRWPDYPAQEATVDDMRLIRSVGMDHIRLPVDPIRLWDFPGEGPLKTEVLEQMDAAIDRALDQGLNVVVDMHPRPNVKEQLENDPATFESFLRFWTVLATHLKQYDSERVALEILNEPMVDDAETWQSMADRLYAVVRAAAPKHTIVIGGGAWSDTAMLRKLVPVDDSNVVYTFHFYEPHVFTHQGARWGEPEWLKLTDVPYPSNEKKEMQQMEGLVDKDARKVFQDHIDQNWNAEKIQGRIAEAAAWAQEHGVVIWCGEFGVYRPYAPPADRARYIRDVRIALEEYGIGWTLWDYQGSFSMVLKEEPGALARVDEPVATALGLSVKEER